MAPAPSNLPSFPACGWAGQTASHWRSTRGQPGLEFSIFRSSTPGNAFEREPLVPEAIGGCIGATRIGSVWRRSFSEKLVANQDGDLFEAMKKIAT